MRRRTLLVGTGAALAVPHALFAQSKRVFRVALFDDAAESARPHIWEMFRDRLRELVLRDGNDLAYEARYARGDPSALPKLAAQLVELKPDLIVTMGTPPTIAAQKATSTIPIVFLGAGDPVGSGLVASLARPGANVTGVSIPTPDISAKHFELMRELAPRATRVAFLTNTSNKVAASVANQVQDRARAEGVTVEIFDGRDRAALERSFESMKKNRMQAMIVGMSTLLLEHRDPIVQFAAREKNASGVRSARVCQGGRTSFLRSRLATGGTALRRVRAPTPEWCQTGRHARRADHSDARGPQLENGEITRYSRICLHACARRRGDRIVAGIS